MCQKCDKKILARGLCRTHYNRLYWKSIASPETLKNRQESYARTRKARQEPDWVPRHLRVKQSVEDKKARVAAQGRFRRHTMKAIVDAIKLELGCQDCGYNIDPIALDFDHVDITDKKYGIARMVSSGRPIDTILQEIRKCVVRCANCHRIKTYEEGDMVRASLKEKIGW